MATTPSPPEEIPTYVADGLKRQDEDTLRTIIEYCEQLLAFYDREIEPDEAVDSDEKLVDVESSDSSGTIIVKEVPCGKNCGGCPHGPYKYRVTRDGDSLNWEYLGPATD